MGDNLLTPLCADVQDRDKGSRLSRNSVGRLQRESRHGMGDRGVTAWLPWLDRQGRVSALRATTFALVLVPALWLALEAWNGQLGSKPWTQAVHDTGTWTVRLLLVTLAVSPLRRILDWGKLIGIRRMLGLLGPRLCGGAYHALLHRPRLRLGADRLGDRQALLSHRRLHGADRARRARRDLDRRDDPKARRQELAAPAQPDLRRSRCWGSSISRCSPRSTSPSPP